MGISNSEIKLVRSLSMKKFRDSLGLFTVEGDKLVAEAIKSGFHVEKIYRSSEIGEEMMKKISLLSTPSPVLAVVKKPSQDETDEDQVTSPAKGLYLALDSIRDPGNLGTILRIADWFGIDGIFATPDTVDLYNPKTVQSTMGAIFRVRFAYANLERFADLAINSGGIVYGTFLDGDNIYDTDLQTGDKAPVVVVIGNEANGISAKMEKKVGSRLYIPPYPDGNTGSESLNAAVATAITVAEFRRRGR